MKRLKLVMWAVIALVAVFVIWRFGFYTSEAKRVEKAVESKVGAEPEKTGEAQRLSDIRQRRERRRQTRRLADANELRDRGLLGNLSPEGKSMLTGRPDG